MGNKELGKKKTDHDFYRMFQQLEPSPDQEKKKEAVRMAVLSWTAETECPQLRLIEGLGRTFITISPITWGIQALLFMLLIWFSMDITGQAKWRIMLLPLMGLLGICEVCRSFQREMWELELACRFSLTQIMVRKLLVFGGMDLFVLAVLTVADTGGAGIITMAWTLLIPFFLMNAFYLFLLNRVRLCRNNYVMCGVMIAMTAVSGLAVSEAESWSWMVRGVMQPAGTMAVLLLSMVLMVYNAVRLCRSGRREELQWNYV